MSETETKLRKENRRLRVRLELERGALEMMCSTVVTEVITAELARVRAANKMLIASHDVADARIATLEGSLDALESWRVDFGFRHALSEAAELELADKLDELWAAEPSSEVKK